MIELDLFKNTWKRELVFFFLEQVPNANVRVCAYARRHVSLSSLLPNSPVSTLATLLVLTSLQSWLAVILSLAHCTSLCNSLSDGTSVAPPLSSRFRAGVNSFLIGLLGETMVMLLLVFLGGLLIYKSLTYINRCESV
jgi:hypothetical protein